jgi:hypothetical protein
VSDIRDLVVKKREGRAVDELVVAMQEQRGISPSIGTSAVDFSEMYSQSVKIFSEQARLAASPDKLNLMDLQVSRTRTENFLNAISGMLEIADKVELLGAEKFKFKRIEELAVLNSLMDRYSSATIYVKKNMDLCQKELGVLYAKMEDDGEDSGLTEDDINKMSTLQRFMEQSIDMIKKLSDGTGKLIETERKSGGRKMGDDRPLVAMNSYMDSFKNESTGDDKKETVVDVTPARKLSESEIRRALENSKDFKEE